MAGVGRGAVAAGEGPGSAAVLGDGGGAVWGGEIGAGDDGACGDGGG